MTTTQATLPLDTETPAELTIRAHGTPIPQGSKNAFVRGGRAVLVDVNSIALKAWRKTIGEAAKTAMRATPWQRVDGPIEVTMTFWLERPPSAPRRRIWPEKKPDIDKLERAVLDALTDAAVIWDDARVVTLTGAKRYAIGRPPGVTITVRNGVSPVVSVSGQCPVETGQTT